MSHEVQVPVQGLVPVHLCPMKWQCGTAVMLLHELVLPNHVYRYVPDSETPALYRSTAPSSKLPMLRTFSIAWWVIPGFDAQAAVRSERLTRRFDIIRTSRDLEQLIWKRRRLRLLYGMINCANPARHIAKQTPKERATSA